MDVVINLVLALPVKTESCQKPIMLSNNGLGEIKGQSWIRAGVIWFMQPFYVLVKFVS